MAVGLGPRGVRRRRRRRRVDARPPAAEPRAAPPTPSGGGAETSRRRPSQRLLPAPSRAARRPRPDTAAASTTAAPAGQAGWHLPRRPHGRQREGHRRRPEHRQQARPGPPAGRLGHARDVRPRLQARQRRAGRGAHRRGAGHVRDPPASEGIEFHDGKTVGADDVIYSIKRLIDPELGLFGGAALASVDPNAHHEGRRAHRAAEAEAGRLDHPRLARPVRRRHRARRLHRQGHVDEGRPDRHRRLHPGELHARPGEPPRRRTRTTGARASRSSTRSSSSTSRTTRRASTRCWRARSTRSPTCRSRRSRWSRATTALTLLESEGGGWLPLCMAIDQEPFTDPRVRQAFRLIVDRDADGAAGPGGPRPRRERPLRRRSTPCYPDRPAAARAGHRAGQGAARGGRQGGPDDRPADHQRRHRHGRVGARCSPQQAKDAGVTVNVKVLDGGTFYGDQYLKWTFSSDFWGTRSYLAQVAAGSLPASPYNETHWPPKDSNFEALYKQALAETDEAARWRSSSEMHQLEYDQGGYIIPFFNNLRRRVLVEGDGLPAEPAAPSTSTRSGVATPPSPSPEPSSSTGVAAHPGRGGQPGTLRRLRGSGPAASSASSSGGSLLGLLTLCVVSIIVFAATQALPGDPAQAILGRNATPESLAALREQLGPQHAGGRRSTWTGSAGCSPATSATRWRRACPIVRAARRPHRQLGLPGVRLGDHLDPALDRHRRATPRCSATALFDTTRRRW